MGFNWGGGVVSCERVGTGKGGWFLGFPILKNRRMSAARAGRRTAYCGTKRCGSEGCDQANGKGKNCTGEVIRGWRL